MLAKSPEGFARLYYTGRRKAVDGRRIDAKAQAVGELLKLVRDTGEEPNLEESRAGLRALAAKFDEPCPDEVYKTDITLPGAAGPRPARMYDAQNSGEPRPTLLYLHGGGWVQGDLETHDGLCGKLAAWAGIRVISLDYRLAPEHPFPAGPDDVLSAYNALIDKAGEWGVDPARMAVGGDSAGGNLTAALMHDLQGAGLPLPNAQLLIYPAVDTRLNTPSMVALKDAYILPVERINWFLDLYVPKGQDRKDPRIAPIFSDRLAGQPEAMIVIGGHDPLWDDGLNYAERLENAGVVVKMVKFPGQIHVFMSATDVIPQGNQAIRQVADWLAAKIA